jgi:hypothetical protein
LYNLRNSQWNERALAARMVKKVMKNEENEENEE